MATPYTYDQIIKALKAEGLVVHEYTGSRDRCRCHTGSHAAGGTKVRPWGPFYGTYTHITAGNLGTRTVESYIRDIINGDPNVPCKAHFVVPPDGSVWVNSVGRANHAGTVSSTSVAMQQAASFSFDKTYDPHRGHDADGNTHSYGIEAIAASAMNAAQREACVRINAALARPQGWDGGESVGHGECSDQRSYADPGLDMGAFRRDVRARITGGATPAPAPAPEPVPEPAPVPAPEPTVSKPHEYISGNLAGYDSVGKGMRTAASRAAGVIPDYLLPKRPLWFFFQECSHEMLDAIDYHFKDYYRLGTGGKGRESLYLKGQGIKILGSELQNVSHMLLKDTKEFHLIAWQDAEGFKSVYVNFHNENEGSTYQSLQLWDVIRAGRKFADKYGISHRNIVWAGDTNLKTFRTLIKVSTIRDIRDVAKTKLDLIYKTTNRWLPWNGGGLVAGSPIDANIFHQTAIVDEAEMLFGLISDHWAHRVVHRLTK